MYFIGVVLILCRTRWFPLHFANAHGLHLLHNWNPACLENEINIFYSVHTASKDFTEFCRRSMPNFAAIQNGR